MIYTVIAFGALAIGSAGMTVNYSTQLTDDVTRELHGNGTGLSHDVDAKHKSA